MTSKQQKQFDEMLAHYNIANEKSEFEEIAGQPDVEGKPVKHEMMMHYAEKKRGAVDKAVNQPSHYQFADMTVEDLIEAGLTHSELMGWFKGNIIKYRMRAFRKSKVGMQDIAKADMYQKFYDEYKMENSNPSS